MIGIGKTTTGKKYWAELRKKGKWWVTRQLQRKFDKVGVEDGSNNKYRKYNMWKLDIDSIREIKGWDR